MLNGSSKVWLLAWSRCSYQMKTKRLRIVLLPLSLGRTFLEHGLDAFLELPVLHPKGLCSSSQCLQLGNFATSSCHLRHLLPLTEPSHCWGALWPWYIFKMLDSYIMYTLFNTFYPNGVYPNFREYSEAWYFCKWGFHEVLMHFPSFSFSAQMGLDILLMNFAQTAWQPKGGWRRKFPAKLDI